MHGGCGGGEVGGARISSGDPSVRRERERLLRNMMDVLLSLEGEYILSTRLEGQEASPENKIVDTLQILNYQIHVS